MTSDLTESYGYNLADFDVAVSRAWMDNEYRNRLSDDARAALSEMGVELPDGVNVTFHEFDPDDRHYFLPPRVTTSPPTTIPEGDAPPGRTSEPAGAGGSYAVARPFMLGTRSPSAQRDQDQRQGW
jgi:hypothetical protein